MYAVMQVYGWNDFNRSLCECIKTFQTKDEAEKFKWAVDWYFLVTCEKRREYIQNYVDEMELPDTNEEGWALFLGTFYKLPVFLSKADFKEKFRIHLRDCDPDPRYPCYFPPPRLKDPLLQVVKIND